MSLRDLAPKANSGNIFIMFNFLLKKMIKSQLKGIPEDQQEMIIRMFEKNPKFFTELAEKIQNKVKQGKDQQAAAMEVLMEHKEEFQKLAQESK